MSTRLIQDLHAGISRRDWSAVEMAANRLRDDVEEMRRILAGTAISSLPNDYPLPRLATDALSTASPPETSACVLYGPYGYLNGHRALPEDTWTVEDDTIKNSDEYFSIPLYAKVEPVFPVSYSEPRSTPEPVSMVEGEAAEIIRGFLSCPEIADCAPEDLDNETRDLERRARRFLASPPSDGELVRMRERVQELEAALKPFADCADEIDYGDKERDEPTPDDEWAKFRLLVGDYRRARAALSAKEAV
jgi:hypothetical protein